MIFRGFFILVTALILAISPAFSSASINAKPNAEQSHFAKINGIQLHYIEMGKGPLVILLHGWPETSYSWQKTMSALSHKYRVVAPDLRGLGLSERTQDGYDKKTIAADIKALIEYLGETQAVVIGHDMGGKAAYVMAHLYPQSISKLVLADCLISGTENIDAAHGGRWYWGFHMEPYFPEMLTQGREKEYIRAQIKALSFKKDAISEETIDEYVKYYSTPGGMTAGFNYFRTLKEDTALVKTFNGKKLVMPVLTITGRHGVGDNLSKAVENEVISLKSIIIEDSGHFVAEETPEVFNLEVMKFLEAEAFSKGKGIQ